MFKSYSKKLGLALLLLAALALTAVGLLGFGASAAEEPAYTITVNITDTVEGGKVFLTVGSEDPREVVNGEVYTLVQGTQYALTTNVSSITGYCVEWTNAAGVPTTNLSGPIGRDLVYNVKFTPEQYTIHYVGNENYDFRDGLVSFHTYNSETQIIDPVRDGYKLTGWLCYDHEPTEGDTTGRKLAESPTLGKQDYSGDIWLEPIWEGIGYCVIRLDCVFQPGQVYNLGECLGAQILTDYRMGDKVLGSDSGPADGYRGYVYYEAYDYASAAITVTISYTVEQIAELEAKLDKVIEDPDVPGYNVVFRYYLPKEYTVTTDLNAGDDTVTFEEGKTMPQKHVFNQNTALPIPSRVGYTFEGWLLTVEGVEGEELLTPGVSIEAKKYDGNITLTARWTPKKYDVTYDWNGKDDTDNAAIALQNKTLLEKFNTYTYDNPVAFPQPIRAGYTFLGWTVLANGEELYEGALQMELPAEMFSMENPGAVTLKANWKANSYTVTLNGNGATEGVAPSTIPVVFDQALNAEGVTIPTYFGYVFLGYWSCDEDGAFVKQYINGEGASVCTAWDIPSDTTLYARWEKLPEVTSPTFKINYLKETIEVEGGIPEGHYVFRLGETVLDVTVDAEGKITVNRKIVSQIDIPDAFFGATIDVLVWGDGISTSNFEGKLSLAARPSAPVLLQEILGVRKDYTTIEIQMAEGLLYTYEFAISRDAEANIDTLVWQSAPRFENLYQGTVYYLYVRVNESEDHPYGIAAVLEGRTEHRKYLEEKIDRLQALKQEGDGEQVEAVIAEAIRQAEALGEELPATFYEDLERLYQETVLAVEFARKQDARIADLRELCATMIATELYSEANETLLQTLCENAVTAIKGTTKDYEIQSLYEEARTKMYAVKISHLTSGNMEMISHSGLDRSVRLSLLFLSDFSSLSDTVHSAIREGNLLYNGTEMTYGGLASALRTKYVVGAYTMNLYTANASGATVVFNAFEGVYEFRLLLTDELKSIEGLMVGYYNEKTGALEVLDTTRDGNCLVFRSDRVADFVILGDPVLDLTVVIAALGVILLCQLIAIILLLVRRAKASRAVKHYSFLPAFALTIRLLPANALTVVVILGALVILLQILLLYLLMRSDLIRRPKARREEPVQEPCEPEQAEDAEAASDESSAAVAYAYAENGEEPVEEPVEDAEDALSEDYYDTDPNNFEEDFSEESTEEDPFAVYAEDGDALSEEGDEQEGELPEKGGEEEPYASEFAYDEEDFIEPAANPRYSLPDEEYSAFEIDPEAAEEEAPIEEVYTEEIYTEDVPAEEVFAEISEEDISAEEGFEEISEEDVSAEEAFEEVPEEDVSAEEAFEEIPEEDISAEEGFEEISEEDVPAEEAFEEIPEEEAPWEDFPEGSAEELWNDSEEPKKE